MTAPPAGVQRQYVEMAYTVQNQEVVRTGNTALRPDRVKIEYHFGYPVSVFVKGPIVRRDGSTSTRRAQVIYGRFGTPLNDCPAWIQLLVVKFERMVQSYA